MTHPAVPHEFFGILAVVRGIPVGQCCKGDTLTALERV